MAGGSQSKFMSGNGSGWSGTERNDWPGRRAATITMPCMRGTRSGRRRTTLPTFVTGPRAMTVRGSRSSAATSAATAGVSRSRSSAEAAPSCTGQPAGPKRSTTSRAMGKVLSSGALPNTALTPRTAISGEWKAWTSARPSSTSAPGTPMAVSVSIQTAVGGEPVTASPR
jgi:hypothetical protein